MKLQCCIYIMLLFSAIELKAENIQVIIAGEASVSPNFLQGTTIPISYNESVLIRLEGERRFIRGVQLELIAPFEYLIHPENLQIIIYSNVNGNITSDTVILEARQQSQEVLQKKLSNIWQIPIQQSHGMRPSPYIAVPTGVIEPDAFPLLFRLRPVSGEGSRQLENMVFQFNVRPILSNEGAVRLNFIYPPQIAGRPLIVLINDFLIMNPNENIFLSDGEHDLVVLSDDYRNISRRFRVERSRFLDLTIELQDPTPLLLFEYPEGARIFINNTAVENPRNLVPIEPGQHEIRFELSNYSIIRSIMVLRGKTYRIAMSIDINITEND